MQGGDYGCPQCYSAGAGQMVLAPEYSGDGGSKIGLLRDQNRSDCGVCALGTNAMVLYDKDNSQPITATACSSLSRVVEPSPVPASGYNVVFQALAGDRGSAIASIR